MRGCPPGPALRGPYLCFGLEIVRLLPGGLLGVAVVVVGAPVGGLMLSPGRLLGRGEGSAPPSLAPGQHPAAGTALPTPATDPILIPTTTIGPNPAATPSQGVLSSIHWSPPSRTRHSCSLIFFYSKGFIWAPTGPLSCMGPPYCSRGIPAPTYLAGQVAGRRAAARHALLHRSHQGVQELPAPEPSQPQITPARPLPLTQPPPPGPANTPDLDPSPLPRPIHAPNPAPSPAGAPNLDPNSTNDPDPDLSLASAPYAAPLRPANVPDPPPIPANAPNADPSPAGAPNRDSSPPQPC